MFYSAALSKDEKQLIFKMKHSIRSALIFILFSLSGMLVFTFSWEQFLNLTWAGKISLLLWIGLSVIGSLYQDRYVFNKDKETISIERGIWPRPIIKTHSFDDLEAVIFKKVFSDELSNQRSLFPRKRQSFGFKIKGKYYLLEKSASHNVAKAYYQAFIAFYPREVRRDVL
ncbi:hypothetical protein [Spirochaeta cellobiosiphila]|uniref:hypothetical protein n=1 Tax=Spirochaeta cellobiosiphila TaxID=504483 RepID=UPI0003F9F6AB|nr:hypothetical protein [Spirochaeta cellobiosiphila]